MHEHDPEGGPEWNGFQQLSSLFRLADIERLTTPGVARMCRANTHILLGWCKFEPIFPRGNFIQCARVENAYTHDSTIPNQAYGNENEKRCLCQYSIFIAPLLKEGEIVSSGVMCPYDSQRDQVL